MNGKYNSESAAKDVHSVGIWIDTHLGGGEEWKTHLQQEIELQQQLYY